MPDNWWESSRKVESDGGDWWKDSPAGGGTGGGPLPALADRKSVLSAAEPQSAWSKSWDAVNDWFFGSPERRELQAAESDPKTATGIGMTPSPAQMAKSGAVMASMVGPAAVASLRHSPILAEEAAAVAPQATSAVGRWMGSHPRLRNAAVGALPGLAEGDLRSAKYGAAFGALFGPAGKAVAESAPAARAAVEKVVSKAAAPVAAKAADLGRAAAERHAAVVAFAKQVAATNPKIGQKIHILLDEAGKPLKWLTSDEAGAAKRAGLPTTFIKNLWGSASKMFEKVSEKLSD